MKVTNLQIKDFTLIHNIDIDLHSGLNVFVGESGSGKSLVLKALKILFGANASTDYIRKGKTKAELSCDILLSSQEEEKFVATFNIDPTPNHVYTIQKQITKSGSKCFVEGVKAQQTTIKEFADQVLGVFAQGDQWEYSKDAQLSLIDQVHSGEVEKIVGLWSLWKRCLSKYRDFKSKQEAYKEKLDLYEFQFNELNTLELDDPEEDTQLEERIIAWRKQKENARLYQDIDVLGKDAISALNELKNHEPNSFLETYSNMISFLCDRSAEWASNASITDENVDELISRVEAIKKMKLKFNVSSIEQLKKHQQILSEKIAITTASTNPYERKCVNIARAYSLQCGKVSKLRDLSAKEFAAKLKKSLESLNFQYIDIQPVFTPKNASPNGIDDFEFFVTFNKGHDPKPLSKVISGGEASRIALSIIGMDLKNDMALILDEIDSGLDPKSLQAISNLLKKVSVGNQIVLISHNKDVIESCDVQHHVQKKINEEGVTETWIVTEN